jgi:thioredoxin
MLNGQAQTVKNVDASQFQKLVQSGEGVILDVRTPQEFSRGHIEGATLINVADPSFVSKVNLLQKDKPVYVYCLTGSRSNAAANYMVKNGFAKVYELQYGIMDWTRHGFPLKQSDAAVASKSTQYTPQSFQQLIQSESVVLVDFNAPWCAPCKAMSPVIEKLAKDYHGKAKVEKVDVESNKAISDAYQIQSIPGFILFKDGQKVWSHKGVISYDQLSEELKKYL